MKGLGLSDSKVILIGDPSVGKTSIIQQYHCNKFEEDSEATIGASFVSQYVDTPLGGVQIHIWDTAGQERYRSLIPMYSRNAAAAILVLDVANQQSYEHIEMWLSIVQANCPSACKVYFVANKIDLEPVIPLSDFEAWCEARSAKLYKTTAKEFKTVAPIFEAVAEDILKSARPITGLLTPQIVREKEKGQCC
jgi:small GTP-binding protein